MDLGALGLRVLRVASAVAGVDSPASSAINVSQITLESLVRVMFDSAFVRP